MLLETSKFGSSTFRTRKVIADAWGHDYPTAAPCANVRVPKWCTKQSRQPAKVKPACLATRFVLLPFFWSMWYESLTARESRRTFDATEASFAGADYTQAA